MSKGNPGERRAALRRSVLKSFDIIANHSRSLPIPADLPSSDEWTRSQLFAHLGPRFYGSGNPRRCVQSEWFGFYALRLAARSLMQAANFLVASMNVFQIGLNAPAVTLAYNAAFLTLHGYLALDGRVYCEDRTGLQEANHWNVTLTSDGKWAIAGIKRDHMSKWMLLKRTVYEMGGQELPHYFNSLFHCLCRPRYEPHMTLKDIIRNRSAGLEGVGLIPMSERLDEFLSLIAEARHIANYEGLGDDARVVDAMVNGEGGGDLSETAKAFLVLSHDFVEDVAARTRALLAEVPWEQTSRQFWCMSCLYPFFDEPRHHLLRDPVQELVRDIWNGMRVSLLDEPGNGTASAGGSPFVGSDDRGLVDGREAAQLNQHDSGSGASAPSEPKPSGQP